MKHFISSLLILCAALVPSAAKAQDILTNNPDNAPYFGIRAGLDIACPGDISVGNVGLDFFKNGAGFNVGGIYNLPVIANFYVEPGVSLFYNTYGVKKNSTTTARTSVSPRTSAISRYVNSACAFP